MQFLLTNFSAIGMTYHDNSLNIFLLEYVKETMSDQGIVDPNDQKGEHLASSLIDTQQKMNLKQYFDEKLHPKLSAALNACAIARPEDPVEFVGNFLLSHPERRV
jgi:hypothetical protein